MVNTRSEANKEAERGRRRRRANPLTPEQKAKAARRRKALRQTEPKERSRHNTIVGSRRRREVGISVETSERNRLRSGATRLFDLVQRAGLLLSYASFGEFLDDARNAHMAVRFSILEDIHLGMRRSNVRMNLHKADYLVFVFGDTLAAHLRAFVEAFESEDGDESGSDLVLDSDNSDDEDTPPGGVGGAAAIAVTV